MPVYEYECPSCEKVFEVQQRMSDDPLKICPDCGGQVKKLVSMSSFHLKGGGWYSDGYSSKSKSSDSKKSKPAKETTVTPPCKNEKSGGCKNCPASS
ncbi:MAG: zinc ribbon domain-containing protein [Desulfobulbus sp.]|nr:MAG: zinc ribbon domain-containing protein [Desulfobulbus sp.]RUM34370.1 MAG: zinc ribbon domain-containing protein [Desulfobulbus sp.]RUM41780.1 MAG: zinc ribbon domain-containing protein [Desulfobulbus sp.]